MKYELIAEKEPYALILRGCRLQQYAVVDGLNREKGEWNFTYCYYDFGEHMKLTREQALFKALDYFLMKTDKKHIPYNRMQEIADLLKNGLIEDGINEAYEYMHNTVELSEYEAQILGLDMEKYKKETGYGEHQLNT